MAKISEIYNLQCSQNELDFIDIDILNDTPLFIDPYRMSRISGPFINEANIIIGNYFSYLTELLVAKNYTEAKKVFIHLNEVNETCLGYSRNKPKGTGLGIISSNDVFEAMKKSQAVKYGLMKSLEDIRVFVPGVDADRISDMTANIIRKLLIEYTKNQCNIFNIPLTPCVASGFYWNPQSRQWEQEYSDMLVIEGKKYILVPKIIVTYGDRVTSGNYFDHFVLNFLQAENIRNNTRIVQRRKCKKNKGTPFVYKKDIINKQLKKPNEEKFTVSKEWLAGFTKAHSRVFDKFKNESFSKMKEIDYNENKSEIAEYLINKLKSIQPGTTDASIYHITMLCVLEFIFYPNISNPRKEQEINEGRKRIDIIYNNTASKGFFYDLLEKYDILASFVMVECKNYSTDVNNPELDQLIGRFSKQRGRFGISTSRIAKDYSTLIKRCSDIHMAGNGLVIPLLDDDIIKILEDVKNGAENDGLDMLLDKFTQVVFPSR